MENVNSMDGIGGGFVVVFVDYFWSKIVWGYWSWFEEGCLYGCFWLDVNCDL